MELSKRPARAHSAVVKQSLMGSFAFAWNALPNRFPVICHIYLPYTTCTLGFLSITLAHQPVWLDLGMCTFSQG